MPGPEVRPADAVEVGRIGEPWGVKGSFRVHAYAHPADALRANRTWHLSPPEPPVGAALIARHPGATPPFLSVRDLRVQGDGLVASARDVDDRDAAAALRGARVFVGRATFPKTAADEYYWADLIGLDVVNRDGAALGRVDGLLDNGPQSVLRVVSGDVERLIPFVSAHVDGVDLAARVVTVDWGLDY